MKRLALLAALVLTAACAPHHVRQPIEEEPFILSPGPPPSVREALARQEAFATAGARTSIDRVGRDRRLPLVHATIAGRPTLMLVDTGAYDHVLEGWFAHALQDGQASPRGATVMDHANRKVAVEQWSALTFAIDGWSPLADIRPLALGDENRGPRALGVGGILSPQRLVGSASIVLDFPAGEMAEVTDGAARLTPHGTSMGTAIRCGASYILPATVEGKEAELLVDTGSFTTDLKATSPPGRALAGRSSVSREIYTVGGAVETRALGDAQVKAGELSVKLDIPLVADRGRPSRCQSDGVLGMDVLGDCVLVIEAMRMRIACG